MAFRTIDRSRARRMFATSTACEPGLAVGDTGETNGVRLVSEIPSAPRPFTFCFFFRFYCFLNVMDVGYIQFSKFVQSRIGTECPFCSLSCLGIHADPCDESGPDFVLQYILESHSFDVVISEMGH